MRNILFTTALFCSNILLHAQYDGRCGYTNHVNNCIAANPDYAAVRSEIDTYIASHAASESGSRSNQVYRIPVVFHVIYNNEAQNLPDSKILEQLDILNRDYNRQNADSVNTRDIFQAVAAPAGIEFYLAEWDPNGNPTNGITRTETSTASFFNLQFDLNLMKQASTGGKDAWDVNHYLNIWVCNLAIPIINTPFILGFATPPDGAPNWPAGSAAEQPEYDGVVLHYEIVGEDPNATGAMASVNRGRTAVHEVGHYLGLRHIWGDGDANTGCTVDDGLSDTPNTLEAQQQTCDLNANTCDEGEGDLPDQIENYMDYSDENCMNMFTAQQVAAMRFVIENFRSDLLLKVATPTAVSKMGVYPNPAETQINWSNDGYNTPVRFEVRNVAGQVVLSGQTRDARCDVDTLAPGLYTLEVTSEYQTQYARFLKR